MAGACLGLACVIMSWVASPAARADELLPKQPADEAKKTADTPAKHWVWLSKQNCWGYGFKREDDLWVIDPGSKRKTAPAAAPAPDPDVSWFVNWLNGQRSRMGLAAVGHDPNLSRWAAANNAQQRVRGMGHFVMGPARRQNAAIGSAASVGSQWMNSPAHRAALLDPTIRWIGLAGLGAYWTFNAN
jgi:Cysteine-rich secretory protein family